MIRLAELSDLPAIAELGPAGTETARLPGKFAPGHWIAFWLKVMESKEGFVLVNDQSGRIDGALGAAVYKHPEIGTAVGKQLFMVGRPKTGGALCLVREFEAECKRRGAGCAIVSLTLHSRAQTVQKFFTRRGFTPAEVVFKKEL